jgi:putative DNA primase/helicase
VIDFKSINAAALPRLGGLLPGWLPGGRIEAGEYVCASLEGGQGRSCSVNLSTCLWGDFATGAKGGDPVSLLAAIRGVKQSEAARELARDLGLPCDNGSKPARRDRRRIVVSYDYVGPDGKLVFQVTRWEPKNFTQRRPDENGGWIPSVKGIELVPYRLPGIIKAKSVFIVEGEKDAEALAALGLAATCNAQGAGKWRPEYNRHFAGKRVCILPDNDAPGRKHAYDVARQLHGLAEVVKVLELPGLPPKGDVSDWLAAGGERESLLEMVKAAPAWEPTAELQDTEDHEGRRQGDEDAILIREGALAEAVDAAEAILARPDLPIADRVFQRAGRLVRVGVLPVPGPVDGVTRPQGAVVILPVEKPFLLTVLSRHGHFKKYDGRAKAWRTIDPPKPVAEAVMSRSGRWPFPVLRGVVACPTLRADGSLMLAPGFDAESGYYLNHGLTIRVPESPTKKEAQEALNTLADLLAGFAFVEHVDCAVALAMIMTAVARPSLDTTPLFSITAPVRGSGKSTLMDIAAVIATGRRSAVLSATSDRDELEKRLVGCLLSGDCIINLDNVNGTLKSDLLCQATTAEAVKVRPLGSSDQAEVPNSALWACNGNNITVASDLARRTLLCRLDPGMERPEERVFAFDPVTKAREHRSEYVTAALTVLRAYIAAGRPGLDLHPFGSFENWSGLVRSALVWLGAVDPCESREAVLEDDPEGATLKSFFLAWVERFNRTSRTVKEIVRASEEDDSPLADVLHDIAGEGRGINTKRLGWWLRRNAGRIVDGMRLTQTRVSRVSGTSEWRVAPVER